jgi:type I restriction enzyme S subunit
MRWGGDDVVSGPGTGPVKLEALCTRITVGHVGSMANEYVAEGVPFLRSQNVHPFRLHLDDVKFITPGFHAKLKKCALRPGDVVVVRTGYPGTAAVVPESLPVSNCADLVVISPRADALDPHYLVAIFNSTWGRATVSGNLVGAAQQHFNIGAARNMEVSLPSLGEQRRIAGILSAYDDLIENCERRIRVLDEMARSLYREWFVDRALSDWKRMPLTEVVRLNPKVVLPKGEPVVFVPMSGLGTEGMLIHECETRALPSGSRFQNGDTLFARITPCLENGKTGFVNFLASNDAGACGSTEFIVMRGARVPPEFVYCLARSADLRAHAIKSMSGATGRQRVQEACFDTFTVSLPPPDLLDRFVALVRPSFDLVHTLGHRVRNLRATRDLLLPRLLSGQLSVDDAA